MNFILQIVSWTSIKWLVLWAALTRSPVFVRGEKHPKSEQRIKTVIRNVSTNTLMHPAQLQRKQLRFTFFTFDINASLFLMTDAVFHTACQKKKYFPNHMNDFTLLSEYKCPHFSHTAFCSCFQCLKPPIHLNTHCQQLKRLFSRCGWLWISLCDFFMIRLPFEGKKTVNAALHFSWWRFIPRYSVFSQQLRVLGWC